MFAQGFLMGLGLVAAIGPEDTFVLRQGLARNHVFLTASSICCFDAILILLSSLGAVRYLASHPQLNFLLTLGGISFLIIYGFKSLRVLLKSDQMILSHVKGAKSPKKIILQALGFSWANPYTILDSVVISGSACAKYTLQESLFFAMGSITVSFLWFFSLAYGAQMFSKDFQKPIVWKIIDGFVGLLCFWIAFGLIKTL